MPDRVSVVGAVCNRKQSNYRKKDKNAKKNKLRGTAHILVYSAGGRHEYSGKRVYSGYDVMYFYFYTFTGGGEKMGKSKMNKVREAVCRLAKKTAVQSVGKSIPVIFFEPTLPEALKMRREK